MSLSKGGFAIGAIVRICSSVSGTFQRKSAMTRNLARSCSLTPFAADSGFAAPSTGRERVVSRLGRGVLLAPPLPLKPTVGRRWNEL